MNHRSLTDAVYQLAAVDYYTLIITHILSCGRAHVFVLRPRACTVVRLRVCTAVVQALTCRFDSYACGLQPLVDCCYGASAGAQLRLLHF